MSKGSSSSENLIYYGTMLYLIGHGPIRLVHVIKVDSVTVWKDQSGIAITGESRDFDTDVGTFRIYKGSWTQQPDTDHNFSNGPAYRGLAYIRILKLKLGSEKTAVPSIEVECTFADEDQGLVSPASVIDELFTDKRIGLGADISYFSCTDAVKNSTIKLAPLIEEETTLEDLCDDLLPLVWCYARFSGQTLTIGRLYDPPEDWDDASIPEISAANCLEMPTITPETPTERITQTIVRWTEIYDGDSGNDTEGEYDNVSIYRDPTAPEISGKAVTIQADAIVTSSVASNFAIAKGHQQALPRCTGSAVIRRDAFTYNQLAYMMPIKVWDDISSTWIRARVTSRSISYDGHGIEIEWENDYTGSIHDSASIGYEAPTFSSLAPVDPKAVMICELPRPLADVPAVGILCARGSGVVNGYGAVLSIDGGANYNTVDSFTAFAVYGLLNTDLGLSSGSVLLTDVTLDSDLVTSASTAQAEADTLLGFIGAAPNHEIVSISTITAGQDQLTVSILRGRLGTAPKSHAAGTPVFIIARSALPIVKSPIQEPSSIINTAANPAGGNAYLFHLPQRVALNIQSADDCDDLGVSVIGEYKRPLPPESVAAASGTNFINADMSFQVACPLWRDEGYPGADFYEQSDISIVPVIVLDGSRHVLSTRSTGSQNVTITAAEISAIIGSSGAGTFELLFYSYVAGRHSRVGTGLMISRGFISQPSILGTSPSVFSGSITED